MFGELIPLGGGDVIPLIKTMLMVGRRESCDIVLRYPNVSSNHCRLTLEAGYWYVEDLNSSNGTKVNGHRVLGRQRLDPGDNITFAKHKFQISFAPQSLGAEGTPPPKVEDDDFMEIMNKSLLESAGLKRQQEAPRRYDPTKENANQLKDLRDRIKKEDDGRGA
jgi:pSer/pThr/pTyr-binding forkhead associated (FHA) protein